MIVKQTPDGPMASTHFLRLLAFLVVVFGVGLWGCKKRKPTSEVRKRTPAVQTKKDASCLTVRAAFDVGSGSTKMKIAQVNTCKRLVVKLLFPTKPDEFQHAVEKVPYKKDLARSFKDPKRKKGHLSEEVLAQGIKAFKKLKALAVTHGAKAFVGVATSAFRQANNGAGIIEKLSAKSGVNVHVISQKVEGLLAYYAVRAKFPKVSKETLLVWDIGGSSMQMIAQTGKAEGDGPEPMTFYLGHLASVPMARHIMFEVQKKKQGPKVSPHPISQQQSDQAIGYVRKRAKKELPAKIVARARKGVVYGVGGVHFFSVQGQVDRSARSYTRAAVKAAIEKRLNRTSPQLARLNSPKNPKKAMRFIETELTNLHLIAGFMDALGIKKVHTASINLASGLFLANRFWRR